MSNTLRTIDAILWVLCFSALVFDGFSLRRMVKRRLGCRVPSSPVFATLPIYWARILFWSAPRGTGLMVRIGEVVVFTLLYAALMYGAPFLIAKVARR